MQNTKIIIEPLLKTGQKIANIKINDEEYALYAPNMDDLIFLNSPASDITNEDIIKWNNKSNFNGIYDTLINIPKDFPTNDIKIYDFKASTNEYLRDFIPGVFSSLDKFNNNNSITIEDKLLDIFDTFFEDDKKKIIKILTSWGPLFLSNILISDTAYHFSFFPINCSNYATLVAENKTEKEIMNSLQMIVLTFILIYDFKSKKCFLIRNNK